MAKDSISAKLPLVGIIMGSSSDWETLEHAAKTLEDLGVPHETSVVSAHRTPISFLSTLLRPKNGHRGDYRRGRRRRASSWHEPHRKRASGTRLCRWSRKRSKDWIRCFPSRKCLAAFPWERWPSGSGAINAALLAAAILGAKQSRNSGSISKIFAALKRSESWQIQIPRLPRARLELQASRLKRKKERARDHRYLGGGQLGYMLALAGYPLGLHFRFSRPFARSSGGRIATRITAQLHRPSCPQEICRRRSW